MEVKLILNTQNGITLLCANLRKFAQGAVSIFVPLEPLERAANKYGLVGSAAANPYTWAFKGIINGVAQNQQAWGVDEPIDFIFDERSEEGQIRDVWQYYLSTLHEKIKALHGRKPIFENDDRVLPLQAADMWAWWCRRGWLEHCGQLPSDFYPIPWGEIGDIPQIILQWSDSEIDAELARVASALAQQEE